MTKNGSSHSKWLVYEHTYTLCVYRPIHNDFEKKKKKKDLKHIASFFFFLSGIICNILFKQEENTLFQLDLFSLSKNIY